MFTGRSSSILDKNYPEWIHYFLGSALSGATTTLTDLWLQLVADGGRVKDFGLATGLARADLNALPNLPLLCLDEVDALRPLNPEAETPAHTQLLAFIDQPALGVRNGGLKFSLGAVPLHQAGQYLGQGLAPANSKGLAVALKAGWAE